MRCVDPLAPPLERTARKLLHSLEKGGVGTTTIASNFAVTLAQESGQSTLLIDLGLPLGDAALTWYDGRVFRRLMRWKTRTVSMPVFCRHAARHSSGLSILAAPTEFAAYEPSLEAIDRMIAVARQTFDYVVVDAGTRMDLKDARFFDESSVLT